MSRADVRLRRLLPAPQQPPPHGGLLEPLDALGWVELLGARLDAVGDGVAAVDAALVIEQRQTLLTGFVPRVDLEAVAFSRAAGPR